MGRSNKQAAKPRVVAGVQNGSTVEQAARNAGVHPSTVAKWRKQDRSFDQQLKDAMQPRPEGEDLITATERMIEEAGLRDIGHALVDEHGEVFAPADQRYLDALSKQANVWASTAARMEDETDKRDMRHIAMNMRSLADALSGGGHVDDMLSMNGASDLAQEWRSYAENISGHSEPLAEAANKLADEYQLIQSDYDPWDHGGLLSEEHA